MKKVKRLSAVAISLFIVLGGVFYSSLNAYAVNLNNFSNLNNAISSMPTNSQTVQPPVASPDDPVINGITYPKPSGNTSPIYARKDGEYLEDGEGNRKSLTGDIADDFRDEMNSDLTSAYTDFSIDNLNARFRLATYYSIDKDNHPCDHMGASSMETLFTTMQGAFKLANGVGEPTISETQFTSRLHALDGGMYTSLEINQSFADAFGDAFTNRKCTRGSSSAKEFTWVYAMPYECIEEFYAYASHWRKEAITQYTTDSGLPDEWKDTIGKLKFVKERFGYVYPIIDKLWYYKTDADGDMSLDDLAKNIDSIDSGNPEFSDDARFQTVLDKTTPLGLFYVFNTENGIAKIDKESVWNDIETDTNAATIVQDFVDDKTGKSDGIVGTILDTEDTDVIVDGTVTPLTLFDVMAEGVEVDGTAVSPKAISMSSYIIDGMTYSTTFIPMKTNLYSPDTLAQFDEDFRYDFYYKYGFMRKALMWDKSGSSVMDYYNANNKVTNTLEVVTLRDVLEAGDSDIALYVDDDFYNAQEAITEAKSILELRAYDNEMLADYLLEYASAMDLLNTWAAHVDEDTDYTSLFNMGNLRASIRNTIASLFIDGKMYTDEELDSISNEVSDVHKELSSTYNFDISRLTSDGAEAFALDLQKANAKSAEGTIDEHLLKTGDYNQYNNKIEALLKGCKEADYRSWNDDLTRNDDNLDTLVLPSSLITQYMEAMSSYQAQIEHEDEGVIVRNVYTSYDDYTPMLSLSYVSALYRDGTYYSLANLVSNDNPVFLASDDLCGIDSASQWYCNTVLNYAFVKNLQSAAQIDYTYVVDLDNPLYIDVFGNILTESGIVVIPASCNATLHNASFKNANVGVGLYTIYGHNYFVPMTCVGAAKSMFPFFAADTEEGVYIINGNTVTSSTGSVKYNEISPYSVSTQEAVMHAYKSYVMDGTYTNVNWIAMVNICNEVMRGAPIDSIDKGAENLNVNIERNKAAVVAAVKLEALIESLAGMTSNTLINIPDFSRMDDMEYLVAFMIKMLMIATAAVIIIGVYRDGVTGNLGLRTFWKSVSSVALTFAAVCVIPAVFQLTYYAANKFLLQNEAIRILMLNQEKYQSGVEIGMLDTTVPESTTDMSIQLDWITVPWYEQLENMLYGSTLQNLDEVKKKAYLQSPVYDNHDVVVYNDGVYVTMDSLFESVKIDYTFNESLKGTGEIDNSSANGLYLYANNDTQTASFYSPYYVFLKVLVGNVNEYNYYHDNYNYTTKYMSGNRLKTVGLCNTYFTSKSFMELDSDIMHMNEIYQKSEISTYDHGLLFNSVELMQIANSAWYCDYDEDGFAKRTELMNQYARDFIANNKDLLTKVTDETFIKAMALDLAIKYNQVFGIPCANAIEIYNMDSNDLLRLSLAPTEEAILSSPMSYARYVYNFGGEPAVYAAAILTVIMWVGSFIKPLCTVITFISVFLSIWVFRVVLRRESANLLGYLITCSLLCFTNILHAVLLKVSTYLPNTGLSMLGCLLFIICGQVIYLLVLAYVTGTSLKDWTNLGYTDYEREAQRIRHKLGKESTADMLNGRIKHHDDNWEYYNDLIQQHRSRNV